MEEITYYVAPFLKNFIILCLTPWIMFMLLTIRRLGLKGFSFVTWLEDNKMRFIVGLVFIGSLSILMAMTDAAPLFKFMGFDINASPVALGVVIGALLLIGIPANPSQADEDQADKVHSIQEKAQEIIKTSTQIDGKENK